VAACSLANRAAGDEGTLPSVAGAASTITCNGHEPFCVAGLAVAVDGNNGAGLGILKWQIMLQV